jgi:hypothetical protein
MSDESELISLSALARRLDISWPRALDLHGRGVLVPDFQAEKAYLFRPSRIPELRKAVREDRANTGLQRAINANIAAQAKASKQKTN